MTNKELFELDEVEIYYIIDYKNGNERTYYDASGNQITISEYNQIK